MDNWDIEASSVGPHSGSQPSSDCAGRNYNQQVSCIQVFILWHLRNSVGVGWSGGPTPSAGLNFAMMWEIIWNNNPNINSYSQYYRTGRNYVNAYIGPCFIVGELYELLVVDAGQPGHGVPHYHDGQVAILVPGPQQILQQHRGNTQCGMWNRGYLNTPLNMLTTPQEGATA